VEDYLNRKQITQDTTIDTAKVLFNYWLDHEFDKLDSFQEKEIAEQIIGPTTFELHNFTTLVELEIFQSQVIEAKMKTEKQVNLEVIGVGDLKLKLYR
jgi:hypothetical protein